MEDIETDNNTGSNNNSLNKVERLSLAGGLIGAFSTNPKRALNIMLKSNNDNGWKAIHIESHRTHNLFVFFVQILVLVLTLGLYTWGGGYLVLFERID